MSTSASASKMFKKATKKQTRLRMAICGPTGSGKTMTALRLAYAFKGADTRVAVVNTESGAVEKYLGLAPDGIPFDFDILTLDEFPPTAYTESIMAAGREGFDVLIIDSLSHAWTGTGGALEIKDKTPGNSYTAWKDVTPMHNRMIESILRSPCHIIVTMRSQMEYVLEERNGRMVPQRVGMAPVQRKGMEYEFDVVADMDLNHMLTVSKSRCPDVDGQKTIKPGANFMGPIVNWLQSGTEVDPSYYATTDDDLRHLQREKEKALPDHQKEQKARQQAAAAAAAYQQQSSGNGRQCDESTEKKIRDVLPETGLTPADFRAKLDQSGYQKIKDIPQGKAEALYHKLLQRKSEKQQADAAKQLEQSGTTPTGADAHEEIQQDKETPVNQETIAAIKILFDQSRMMPERFKELLTECGVSRVRDMTQDQALNLKSRLEAQQSAGDGDASARKNETPTPPRTEPGTVRDDQFEAIKSLADDTGWSHQEQTEWLNGQHVNSFRSLSEEQADALIAKLEKSKAAFIPAKN